MDIDESTIELIFFDKDINLDSKTAMIWAFDEVIDSNTSFEGNNLSNTKKTLIDIIKFIQKNNIYHDIIDENLICEYLKILDKLVINLDNTEYKIDIKDSDFFLCGWYNHGILLFYNKNSEDNYTVGIINAGQGVEYQGIENENCNGIMIFENIHETSLQNFLEKYKKFYELSNNIPSQYESYLYFKFYMIIVKELIEYNILNFSKDCIDNIKSIYDNGFINFFRLNELKYVKFIQIKSQILGTCTFTNTLNYIIYMIYKKKPDLNLYYLNIFQEWYELCKIYIKINISKTVDEENYTIYEYINDIIYNIDKLQNKQLIEKNKIIYKPDVKKIFKGIKNNPILTEIIDYNEIFIEMFNGNNKKLSCLIQSNISNKKECFKARSILNETLN